MSVNNFDYVLKEDILSVIGRPRAKLLYLKMYIYR